MTAASELLNSLSTGLADAVQSAAPSVVQVHGARRPASGLVCDREIVVTTARALGREDELHVRRPDGTTLDAELAGWDPTTSLAVLRVPGLEGTPIAVAAAPPRVGHLVLAVARSWSNVVSASAGIVAIIGGPLPTGRRRSIDEVIRTTAPMHDGFAGGALIDTAGALLGINTSLAIRGTRVAIPASIVRATAATIVEHGQMKRGYLGIVGQPVQLPEKQRPKNIISAGSPSGSAADRETGLLVMGITQAGPAEGAGVLVGDVLLDLDDQPIESPEALLDLLVGARVGKPARLRLLRGGTALEVPITVGERPKG